MAHKWYVVHTYSGYENKVKAALEDRIKSFGREEYFSEILIPSEKVVELVKGERRTSTRKFFPGYIFVKMELNDETWHIVKNTPKVTGFIGSRTEPTPISVSEVEEIFRGPGVHSLGGVGGFAGPAALGAETPPGAQGRAPLPRGRAGCTRTGQTWRQA
jgi:transcription antitermination factor NusG